MGFNHILVPFDGSAPSVDALNQAIWLAKSSSDARLTVAHVISLQPIVAADMTFFPSQAYQEQLQENANAILDHVKEKLEGIPNTNVVLLNGAPAAKIVNFAESEGCDLIVIGSRGLSAMKEFMLGSVSHNVVQQAKMPVLIVK